jgi:hypothetical protein
MELVHAYVERYTSRLHKILGIAMATVQSAMEHFKNQPNTPDNRKLMQDQINFALEKLEKDLLPKNRFIICEVSESVQPGSSNWIKTYFADQKGNKISDQQIIEEVTAMDAVKRDKEKSKKFFKGHEPRSNNWLRGAGSTSWERNLLGLITPEEARWGIDGID